MKKIGTLFIVIGFLVSCGKEPIGPGAGDAAIPIESMECTPPICSTPDGCIKAICHMFKNCPHTQDNPGIDEFVELNCGDV